MNISIDAYIDYFHTSLNTFKQVIKKLLSREYVDHTTKKLPPGSGVPKGEIFLWGDDSARLLLLLAKSTCTIEPVAD